MFFYTIETETTVIIIKQSIKLDIWQIHTELHTFLSLDLNMFLLVDSLSTSTV